LYIIYLATGFNESDYFNFGLRKKFLFSVLTSYILYYLATLKVGVYVDRIIANHLYFLAMINLFSYLCYYLPHSSSFY